MQRLICVFSPSELLTSKGRPSWRPLSFSKTQVPSKRGLEGLIEGPEKKSRGQGAQNGYKTIVALHFWNQDKCKTLNFEFQK